MNVRRLKSMLAAVCGLFAAATLHAEPYIAVREGFKCSQCHVNRTGGGKRNAFGTIFSQTTLIGQATPEGDLFTGRVSDFIAFGGDLRASYDFRDFPNNEDTSEFKVDEGFLYLQVDLIPGELLLYLDQQIAPGAAFAREAFALYTGLPGQSYIKAGRFFLPYGLRLEDDTAFIRSVPQLNMNNPDVGLEFGHQPGAFSFALAVTNGAAGGTDDNKDKQVTLLAAWVGSAGRIGGSYARNEDVTENNRTAYNLFGGVRAGPFTVLAEGDVVRDKPLVGAEREQLAGLAEVNWLLAEAMNLKLSYDWHDPNRETDDDERQRTSLVFEPFVRRFTQLRIGVRINESVPQNELENADDFFLQLHVFF